MSDRPSHVPDLILERYLLDELAPNQQRELTQRLSLDEGLRQRLEALRESDRELLAQYPTAWVGRQIRMRGERPRVSRGRSWWGWTRVWLAPAAIAVAVAVVVPDLYTEDERPAIRIKGMEPSLRLFRSGSEGVELLTDGSAAVAGDRIQIVYNGVGQPFGTIFSVDGAGTRTFHLPQTGQHAAPLAASGPDTLGFSYQLDDAPRFERFYLITADVQFDLAVARRAMEGAAESGDPAVLQLPPGFMQHAVTLVKDASR